MSRVIFILILSLISFSVKGQKYLTTNLIEKAESHLKEAVGDSLFGYFQLDPNSYYQYRTKSGKVKWEKIGKRKYTKGDFVNGKQIVFVLDHPDFDYKFVDKRIVLNLDSDLNLAQEIDLQKIPDFLLKNRPSNWLTRSELDEIIAQQDLNISTTDPTVRLEFNSNDNHYYWIVFNTLNQEKCFSDQEILHIEPSSGKILKHYEERQFVLHCVE
jgi:hypothetical protein